MQRCLKKISAWLLVVCVLLSQTSYVFAQDTYSEPTLCVSTVTAEAGGTVDITVTMHNNPGIVSMQLDVVYDSSVLTLTKVTDGGLIGAAVHSNNLSLCPYRLTWANDLSLTNYTDNGTIVTLTFAVAENAAAGEYSVAVTYTKNNFEIFDKDANEIDFDLVAGSVTLKAAQCAHTDKAKTAAKSADCVNTGNDLYYVCNDCGTVLKADGITETTVEAETIPALGHDLADATCESPATCKREGCGYSQGGAKGHDWSEKLQYEAHLVPGSGANCQNVKQYYYDCAHCDAIGPEIWDSTDVGGHKLSDTWQSENGEHYHVCTVEGCDYVADKSACAGGTMTCEEKAVCSVCGKPYGELAPHALEEVPSKSADCEHSGNHKYYVCGVCGDVYKADGVTQTTVEAETIPALGHSYNTNVIAPTCTEVGFSTHICVCGDRYVDTYTAALGHDYGQWYETKASTLEAEGEERRDCSRCGDYQTRKLPMLVHNYTSVVTPPTCTEQGYTTHTCSNCGDVYVDSYVNALDHSFTKYASNGDATCTVDGTKTAKCDRCDASDTVTDVGSKTGHDMGEWYVTKDPTCTEKGTEQSDCAKCDHYETREIDAKGHSYTDQVTAPTCTEKGYTTHTCSCGESYIDSYVAAAGHTMGNWYVTKESTCTEKGTEQSDCAKCDHYETREIDAKGHSYTDQVTAPTCTEKGYTTHTCSCGESYLDTYTPAQGHDYGQWYETKAPALEAEGEERRDCSRCDDYQTRKLPMLVHSYTSVVTAPTCTEKGYTTHTCTNCGDVYVDSYVAALGHSFTNYTANGDATCTADGTKTARCDRCDATDTVTDVGSKTGHTMGDWVETKAPTCTEKGTEKIDCANCNHYETRETAAKGHTVVIDKAVEATCIASGLTEGKHCSVCGEVLVFRKEVSAKGHRYTDAVTAPTCTEKGYTTHTCHCGDSYVDTYADALDHAWNEGVVTLEPTEETEGIRLFSCSRCDAEKSEPIHCLNPHIHNYGYSVVVTEATCFQDGYTTYTCNCGASYVDDYVRSHELNLFDDNFSDKFYEKLTKPTCTESGGIFYVCRDCGESILYAYMEARGHDFGEWETVKEPNYLENGLKERHCSLCEVFESEEIHNNPFTDVGEGSRFKTAILWAYYSGVTSGKTATTFEPDATVTRAQFVTFLWRAAGCPEPETVENPFTDVGEGAYYYKAVMWAVENKITIGTTATTFSPDKLCTRGHVAMFLYRYAGEPVISLHDDRFEDVTPNNRYYKAIVWAIQEGITVGKTATTFGLHQECTRAQVVTFLYRYLEEQQ